MARLHGTREEHEAKADRFLEKAWHSAEDAHRMFEEGKIKMGWHNLSKALMHWGSYIAESNWSGRHPDEDRLLALLKRTERSFLSAVNLG